MARCSLCFDNHKVSVADEIQWCPQCTPAHVRGQPTTAGAELPKAEAPKRKEGTRTTTLGGIANYTIEYDRNRPGVFVEERGVNRGDFRAAIAPAGPRRGARYGETVAQRILREQEERRAAEEARLAALAEIPTGFLDAEGTVADPSYCVNCGHDDMTLTETNQTVETWRYDFEQAGDRWLIWGMDHEEPHMTTVKNLHFSCAHCENEQPVPANFDMQYD